jgi:hypothetical protein
MKTPQKFGSARSRPSHPPGLRGLLVLGLVCLSAFSPTAANAEVAVDGDRDQMQMSVDNDTVGRALEALGQKEKLQFHSSTPLNKVIGGSFSGSLEQVLSRVLAGYDFAVRYNLQDVEIFVVGKSGVAPIPPPPVENSPQPQTAPTDTDQDTPNVSLAATPPRSTPPK